MRYAPILFPIPTLLSVGYYSGGQHYPMLFFINLGELMTYEEVLASADSINWWLAMELEMNSIKENRIWDPVELSTNRHALPCKWVFQLKETFDSASPKYKSRLVAKGFLARI